MSKELSYPSRTTVSGSAGLYLDLTKPKLTFMALITTLTGYYLAPKDGLSPGIVFPMITGAALVGAGANALNQYLERGEDAKMRRTLHRPLPSKELHEKKALVFGIALSCVGMLQHLFFVGWLTALISFTILATYLFLYTPLKQRTSFNTLVGAVPGALPILLGYSVCGAIGPLAWLFFAILFFWQLPHFFSIAWVYREDYAAGGFRMLSLDDPLGKKTALGIASSSLVLFAVSLLPSIFGHLGALYFSGAFWVGLFFTSFALYSAFHKLVYVRQMILASILYLSCLNFFVMIDKF